MKQCAMGLFVLAVAAYIFVSLNCSDFGIIKFCWFR